MVLQEFCNQGSLADAVEKGAFRRADNMFECDYAPLLATAREIASAMCYLHSCRIVHSDLSSNNVLLASSEKVRATRAARYPGAAADVLW